MIHDQKLFSESCITLLTISKILSLISILRDEMRLSFFSVESQKILSIFISVHILAFCVTIFSFVSSIFTRSIFAVGVPTATILYFFRANFAFFPSILVQPFSPLNFSASSLVVVCMATSPYGRVCAARSLVVVMLFSLR